MAVHGSGLALLAIAIALQIIVDRRVSVKIGFCVGFGTYFIVWALICWSEWHAGSGASGFAMAALACSVVGSVAGVVYGGISAIVGLGLNPSGAHADDSTR